MRETLKRLCPMPVLAGLRKLRNSLLPGEVRSRVFTDIFRTNYWNDDDSLSGSGSNLEQTAVVRRELPVLLAEAGARSMLDAPCGDLHWIKHCELGLELYIGADIVPELVDGNTERFGGEGREFILADITTSALPSVDVIFCRDCLVHLSYREALQAIRNFVKSGSGYLLTTHFTSRTTNTDIVTGEWRPLNLCLPPFNFPQPLKLVNEKCTELGGQYADKCLALWRLEDLPV